MKVAITGSTGLIGKALVVKLAAGGHEVVRVVRTPIASNEPTIQWNPGSGEIDRAGFEGVDAVVHLAGESIGGHRWTPHQKQVVKQSRVDSTRLLTSTLASLDRPPSVLLSGSAIGYYGDRGDEVLHEDSGPGDLFLSEVVVAWEDAAQAAVDAGIRTCFLRTGIVLDRQEGALAQMLPLFRFGLGGRLGSGKQWFSWITLDDHVAATEWLLTHDVAGPVNLVAPNPVTNEQFTKTLGHVLGRPTLLPVPAFGPRLLLGAQLADELLFAGQRVDPGKLESTGFEFTSRELEDGLRRVLAR